MKYTVEKKEDGKYKLVKKTNGKPEPKKTETEMAKNALSKAMEDCKK